MDLSEVMISEEEINAMVDRLATQINNDYQGEELIVVSVLTGGFVFTADLVRKLTMPVKIDFVQAKSYSGTTSTGELTIKKDISMDIAGKNVLIVEDIIDTGNTLKKLKDYLNSYNPKSLKLCTAFDKPDRRVNDLSSDYNGIVIPDEFIVGYGLDYDDSFRNFKDVRIVR